MAQFCLAKANDAPVAMEPLSAGNMLLRARATVRSNHMRTAPKLPRGEILPNTLAIISECDIETLHLDLYCDFV